MWFASSVITMESSPNEGISPTTEQKYRELSLERENQIAAEVPQLGRESSVKVTKMSEDLDLGGSLKEHDRTAAGLESCSKPGEPTPSVDHIDDTGIDCTKDPDWKVVQDEPLLEKPQPHQVHNDKYWDERSLDRLANEKDLQEEMIRRESEDFDRAAHRSDDASRPFRNEVLDPYYGGGSPPSEPPSSSNSLDSFV